VEERSAGRDPYSNTKFSYNQKKNKDQRRDDKNEMTSQKSFKMTSNLSNLEDSIGVIGSSLSKVQIMKQTSSKINSRQNPI